MNLFTKNINNNNTINTQKYDEVNCHTYLFYKLYSLIYVPHAVLNLIRSVNFPVSTNNK